MANTTGKKFGGRKKGTPNKKTQEVLATLEELGCDPIRGMALIALDDKNDIKLRSDMFKELAQYVAPKRKSIEHTGGVDLMDLVVNIPLPSGD